MNIIHTHNYITADSLYMLCLCNMYLISIYSNCQSNPLLLHLQPSQFVEIYLLETFCSSDGVTLKYIFFKSTLFIIFVSFSIHSFNLIFSKHSSHNLFFSFICEPKLCLFSCILQHLVNLHPPHRTEPYVQTIDLNVNPELEARIWLRTYR